MAGLSLLDIRRRRETVKINDDQSVDVVAMSFDTIAMLLERFPILFEALTGRLAGTPLADLIKKAPEAIGAMIAAGADEFGNEKAEQNARMLGLGDQIELLQAIGRVTFPKGVRPLLEWLNGGTSSASTVPASADLATNSPRPSPDFNAIRSTLVAKKRGNSPPDKPVPSSSSTEKSESASA